MALIAKTRPQAALVLADGTVFQGESTGAAGLTVGEVVFNTSMTGYQEILTDPSYTGQLVTLTCAHIGNVGVNPEDMESNAIHAAGLIVKAAADVPSNWRARQSLPEALKDAGVKAICGIDTRALTIHLRTTGAQAGAIIAKQMGDELTDEDLQQALEAARSWGSMAGQDLAKTVTTDHVYDWTDGSWEPSREGEPAGFRRAAVFPYHVVAYDFGIKTNILRLLADRGIRVTVVPAQTPFEEAMKHQPDGIFLSNGPGDPAPCTYAIEVAQKAIAAKLPLFGICLGHQIMGLAVGAKTLKMKFGHHGANHPVENVETKRVYITSQNHGFAVDADTLPAMPVPRTALSLTAVCRASSSLDSPHSASRVIRKRVPVRTILTCSSKSLRRASPAAVPADGSSEVDKAQNKRTRSESWRSVQTFNLFLSSVPVRSSSVRHVNSTIRACRPAACCAKRGIALFS